MNANQLRLEIPRLVERANRIGIDTQIFRGDLNLRYKINLISYHDSLLKAIRTKQTADRRRQRAIVKQIIVNAKNEGVTINAAPSKMSARKASESVKVAKINIEKNAAIYAKRLESLAKARVVRQQNLQIKRQQKIIIKQVATVALAKKKQQLKQKLVFIPKVKVVKKAVQIERQVLGAKKPIQQVKQIKQVKRKVVDATKKVDNNLFKPKRVARKTKKAVKALKTKLVIEIANKKVKKQKHITARKVFENIINDIGKQVLKNKRYKVSKSSLDNLIKTHISDINAMSGPEVLELMGTETKRASLSAELEIEKRYPSGWNPTNTEYRESVVFVPELLPNDFITDVYIDIIESYEGDYEVSDIRVRGSKVTSADTVIVPKSSTNIAHMRMRRSEVINYNNIPFNKDFKHREGKCVIDYLVHHFDKPDYKKLRKISEQFMLDTFEEAYQVSHEFKPSNDEQGVTAYQIQYLCQKINLSMYCLDLSNEVILKHVGTSKHNPVIFYCCDNHMYPINESTFTRSIAKAQSNVDKRKTDDYVSSHVFKSKNDDNVMLTVADDKVEDRLSKSLENLTVAELQTCKDVTVYYQETNLIELMKALYQFESYIDMKMSKVNNNIIKINYKNGITLVCDSNYKMSPSGKYTSYIDAIHLCDKLDIQFRNQSLSAIVMELFARFMKCKRIPITKKLRSDIAKRQRDECAICNRNLVSTFDLDHIKPVSAGGSSKESNLQALCTLCHKEKTASENEGGVYVRKFLTESSFNFSMKHFFEDENLFNRFAFIDQIESVPDNKTLYTLDINGCRRNILINNIEKFSTFTVMDEPEEYFGEDLENGFWYLVETNSYFPMRGTGIYSSKMVQYCLDIDQISKSDIKYFFNSAKKRQADYFVDFIEYIRSNIDPVMYKLAINSLVGNFAKKESKFQKCFFTRNFDEAVQIDLKCDNSHIAVMRFENDETADVEKLFQITHTTETKWSEDSKTFYNLILEIEAIELHTLASIIQERGGTVHAINTDAVQFTTDDNLPLKDFDINNIFWDANKTTLKYKYEDKEYLKIGRMTNSLNSMNYYTAQVPTFKNITEYEDMDTTVQTIMNLEKGILINGQAGTGKTYLLKKIISEIEKRNDKVIKLAPTNTAARLINGETIHKFFYINKANSKSLRKMIEKVDWIIVDEISMLSSEFYKALGALKEIAPHLKFIMSGDFNQLLPVNDEWQGNYSDSNILKELVDQNKLELTICRRSDDITFNVCKDLTMELNLDITSFGSKRELYGLCHTNHRRIIENEQSMKDFIRLKNIKNTITIAKSVGDDNAQHLTLCFGMPIIARKSCKDLDVCNNEKFKINKIKGDDITLTNSEKEIIISKDKFQKLFTIAFYTTVHKSQGQTFDHPYTIFEWNTPRFDHRMKYVAVSRTTDLKNVNIIIEKNNYEYTYDQFEGNYDVEFETNLWDDEIEEIRKLESFSDQ